MAEHMQDEADLAALKRWWDENGKGIVAAVVVAALGAVTSSEGVQRNVDTGSLPDADTPNVVPRHTPPSSDA